MFLLSFDIEEFDMPFEYGKEISFEDQIRISVHGTHAILDLLKKHDLKATFFSTATFAIHAPEVIGRIAKEGHELASHTYHHSSFKTEDLLLSKLKLEELSGLKVRGFRMPRMAPVGNDAIAAAGYVYNSSVNPTWLPGRYNNLGVSRTWFMEQGVMQIPASVSPLVRFPMFWLSFHNLPLRIYKFFISRIMRTDGYANIYFHPWEFYDLNDSDRFGFPRYVVRNSGEKMRQRMDNFMGWIKQSGYPDGTFSDFVNKRK